MDLRGAKIQNFYKITADVKGDDSTKPSKEVRIPHYQRPFKWSENEIQKLIKDWDNEGRTKYFAGSIVTVASNDKTHQLIDGQQRFTTTFLSNFICFLISRILLREAIDGSRIYHLTTIFEQYRESLKFLLSNFPDNKVLNDNLKEIELALDNFAGGDSKATDLMRKETLAKLTPLLGLPDVNIKESDDNYGKQHKKHLHDFIKSNIDSSKNLNIALTYDRKSYNEELLDSLTSTCITLSSQDFPKITFTDIDVDSSENIKNYTNALKAIFRNFIKITDKENKQDPFPYALEFSSQIRSFLENVSFCIVQTGNVNDAYTLFEVLNDRALALDDLDLIKNQFYKKFVSTNEEKLSPSQIDKTIQEIDEQWVSEIFKDEPEAKRNTIAYLAIVFITGNTAVKNRDGLSYRNTIQSYLNSLDDYSENDIKVHFNIFLACKIFLEVFDLKFGNQTHHALKHELNLDSSTTLKTAHFLMAIDQVGVLSGLVNFILLYVSITDNNPEFKPSNIRNSFKVLLGNNCPKEITDQSYDIWRTSMLADKAEKPRELARKLIRDNYLGQSTFRNSHLSATEHNNLSGDFKNWLRSWQYRPQSPKVRLLFAKLIKLSKNNQGDLVQKNISKTLSSMDIADLQLDHMEPRTINDINNPAYFQAHDRKQHVDGLGNMMPLPKTLNIQKSNRPLSQSFTHYEQAGLSGSFLLEDAEKLYNVHKTNSGAPNSDFFDQRKEELIGYFEQAVELRPVF